MIEAKRIYAEKALQSLPRLLSLLDRNSFSPTYGCFHRDYWLYKTSDFPDAVRQFGVHALALVYANNFPNNPYRGNHRMREWTIAALDFWAKIQHADGSFDEFYPFERGWVGPTAFTTYTSSEALRLLGDEVPPEVSARVKNAIRRAAQFIAAGETEEDHLANHHAMAFLSVSTAADILDDAELRRAAQKLLAGFLRYHVSEEGWCLEYDGADPGYLSATVSFLGKVYARHPSQDLRAILEKAAEFCSYFVYPDGSYAGVLGSRNTLHFYPHGFELLAPEIPLAGSIADRMASALAEGKLVPPEIMSDRYVHYRVPEFLLASLDARPRPQHPPLLPYQRSAFVKVFPKAGIAAAVHGPAYTVANLAKGGVVRSVHAASGKSLLTDSGWVGELDDGRFVTSQWIDPTYHMRLSNDQVVPAKAGTSTEQVPDDARGQHGGVDSRMRENDMKKAIPARWSVSGELHVIPSAKLFTLTTNLAFRSALRALGWFPPAAHWLKGKIRKTLILGRRPIPCAFTRVLELRDDALVVTDTLENAGNLRFRRVTLGGDIPLRYVPQSRFFQPHELVTSSQLLSPSDLDRLNRGETLQQERTILLTAPLPEATKK
ncbi:MAG: hypothetical protein G01um1014106_184 [Parcubacteria group bacterium Gr01-1014_106]|nr:MAG: hypothetical protein G01um1014106_184 [Parcubacteria group bacterium Gr01-1014_106]